MTRPDACITVAMGPGRTGDRMHSSVKAGGTMMPAVRYDRVMWRDRAERCGRKRASSVPRTVKVRDIDIIAMLIDLSGLSGDLCCLTEVMIERSAKVYQLTS